MCHYILFDFNKRLRYHLFFFYYKPKNQVILLSNCNFRNEITEACLESLKLIPIATQLVINKAEI